MTLLWLRASLWASLWASLGLVCFTARASSLRVMAAPSLLRVGTAEHVFVECQDCSGQGPMEVLISAWNYPTRNIRLQHTTVTLHSENRHQALGRLVIPSDMFEKDPLAKHYVYLQAAFPGFTLEKVVLVSFQSGFMFIQTDQSLYTHSSKVKFRIFALTPDLKPVGKDQSTGTPTPIAVEIVTPEGMVIPQDPVVLREGTHHGTYQLGEVVSTGRWRVVSRFQNHPQQTYSAEFEVKKYVLPSYEVKLTPESAFYFYDSQTFRIEVRATYLFGEGVDGTAHVVFGVMKDGIRKVFPSSLQRIVVSGGTGAAALEQTHILRLFPNPAHLVGGCLFVTALVHTESGSEMVQGELRNMHIVRSPYTINFDKTPKYFKAGMPFDVTVEVLNPDGTPAGGVWVTLEPGPNGHAQTQANGRVTLTINTRETDTRLALTARTNYHQLPLERQARATMEATPHETTPLETTPLETTPLETRSKEYIHIYVMTADVKVGSDIKVQLNLKSQNRLFEITFLILSKGQLVTFGRHISEGQDTVVLSIPVSREMLPSFRLVVYFHPTPTQVVSDSVQVEVDASCGLKLEPKRPATWYGPRQTFSLKVTGDPGATVGLVAVDKWVHILNTKHLLTQKKVWETVQKADTGCTPGGGANSMGVFFDAGLMFQADTVDGTPLRQEVKCTAPERKKRAMTLTDAKTTLVSAYEDSLQRECCLDGMKPTPLSYTCATRKLYISEGKACEDAFLRCCEELEMQRGRVQQNQLILAHSEEDHSYMESYEITSRTQFPESWEWVTIKIPQCGKKKTCEVERNIPLKHSITTWVFTGISLSENTGICVGKPLDVVVFKMFFIDLTLPHSAVVGEQIEIRAIIHNYMDSSITVRVELTENLDVCSSAWSHGRYSQEVKVGPSATRAVPFVIVPMKEGEVNVEVKAAVENMDQSDGVVKLLRVVPIGALTKVHKVIYINPRGRTQTQTVNNMIAMTEKVPNTPSSTKAFVSGREQVSPLVDSVTGTSSMGSLIYRPTGCGEQNMFHMTQSVIAMTYLDKTNQWEAVGLEKRHEAVSHIHTGFRNQMNYVKSDGSFAMWPHEKSSVWDKTDLLCTADNLVGINNGTICNAVKFLILRAQKPDGMFQETGRIYHREYTGDVLGRDSDVSLTAFCLIAMQESRQICEPNVNSLRNAINKSVSYLEKRVPFVTNPYAVAITSYALANENKLQKAILDHFVSPDQTHWTSPQGHVFSLEATAYALLAIVKAKFVEEARPVVRWFTKQQTEGGGYGSTQATLMVYQAVSEYWTVAKESNYNLTVEMNVPGRAVPYTFRFYKENHHITRTSKNFGANENVKVRATGTGEATLTLVTQYYAPPKDPRSDCAKFSLSLDFTLEKVNEKEGDIYKLRIEFSFKNEEEDASMSILDIALPTGFEPMTEDLNALSEGHARVVSAWGFHRAPSEKGSLILYLDKVSHDRTEELAIRLRQTHKVGVLQPASVALLEYFDETKCVKYYHPQRRDARILKLCNGQECLCAEAQCGRQKKGPLSNAERMAKVCETTLSSRTDFVYNVTVESAVYDAAFDTYLLSIGGVIKAGTYHFHGAGHRFLSPSHCRDTLNLQTGKGYLLMGASEEVLGAEPGAQLFEYFLGERTWIEFWPRGDDCGSEEHTWTCSDLEALVRTYEAHGCSHK